jgi:hypothetical protein
LRKPISRPGKQNFQLNIKNKMMKTKTLLPVWLLLALTSCAGGSNNDFTVDLIPVYTGEKYIYMNSRGEVAIEPAVDVVETSVFRGKYAVAGIHVPAKSGPDTRYGFLNRSGQLGIAAEYKKATAFSEGLAWVVRETEEGLIAIDETGREVFRLPDATEVRWFQDGLAAFKSKSAKNNWGYIDKTGAVVIEPVYRIASDFFNGFASVSTGKGDPGRIQKGYINRKGEMIIPEQFDNTDFFTSKGYAVVGEGRGFRGKYGVIDRKGQYVIEPVYNYMTADGDEFYVGLGEDDEDVTFGYVNIRGEETVPVQYPWLCQFMGNKYAGAYLSGGDKGGIIDRKGNLVIESCYPIITPFVNGVAVVQNGIRAGDGMALINEKGDTVADLPYPMNVAEDYFRTITAMNSMNSMMGGWYESWSGSPYAKIDIKAW